MPHAAAAKIITVISPLRIPAIHKRVAVITDRIRGEIEVPEYNIKGIAITAMIVTASGLIITRDIAESPNFPGIFHNIVLPLCVFGEWWATLPLE
jgi:hypothetical protein